MLQNNFRWFLGTVSFFTRIPVRLKEINQEDLDRSLRYFPFLGCLLGSISALLFFLIQEPLGIDPALIISIAICVLLTGALHEDGLADFADGFGGGYTKEKILEIMKDSRIGTFGAIALIFIFTLKFSLLKNLSISTIPVAIVIAQGLSRITACSLTWRLSYARETASYAGQLLKNPQRRMDIVVQCLTGVIIFYFLPFQLSIGLLTIMFLFHFFFSRWILKWIGGYTGDCLGAAQQISEVLILAAVATFQGTQNLPIF